MIRKFSLNDLVEPSAILSIDYRSSVCIYHLSVLLSDLASSF